MLDTNLVRDFRENSQIFVALCRVSKKKILFDSNATGRSFEDRYIYSALSYIWEYYYSKFKRGHNCILRVLDNYVVHIESWVPEKEIKCQF